MGEETLAICYVLDNQQYCARIQTLTQLLLLASNPMLVRYMVVQVSNTYSAYDRRKQICPIPGKPLCACKEASSAGRIGAGSHNYLLSCTIRVPNVDTQQCPYASPVHVHTRQT